ncbi:MAG: hypothetical protein ABI540_05340 [Spartobacteria bacterium]
MNRPILLPSLFLLLGACLALAQTPSPTFDFSPTGISGVISISPIQGGPTRQETPDAKPLSEMAFEVKQGSREIKIFRTDDSGHFRVELAPGHYTIVRKDWKAAVGSYGPFEVEVAKGKMTNVEWKCDSGLR